MKCLYIECKVGVAGDMLTAALLEHVDREEFLSKINSLDIPKVKYEATRLSKNSVIGNKVHVIIDGVEESPSHHLEHEENLHNEHEHNHHHSSSLGDIGVRINGLNLSDKVKKDALSIYNLLAEAESRVHGIQVKDIHFHEVGTIDAIVDVISVCILMEMISPDRIVVSPINVGSGMVKCAHGILPVPAPATAILLEDVPIYSDNEIDTELCTPTGAALIKYFADEFGEMPSMKVGSIGYGFGTKEFTKLNCVRSFLGEEVSFGSRDRVLELKCNIDDMTGEDIGFSVEKLLECNALDVFTTPISMKKNRPGTLLTVICAEESRDEIIDAIFRFTTTIGIRESLCDRYVLDRQEEIRDTEYGDIRIKNVSGYGVSREKPEYEDIKKAANDNNLSPMDIRDKLR